MGSLPEAYFATLRLHSLSIQSRCASRGSVWSKQSSACLERASCPCPDRRPSQDHAHCSAENGFTFAFGESAVAHHHCRFSDPERERERGRSMDGCFPYEESRNTKLVFHGTQRAEHVSIVRSIHCLWQHYEK